MEDNFELLVRDERIRQDERWGEQNHDPFYWLGILVEEVGEFSKAILDTEQGGVGNDVKDMETELTHVAAVCKAIWESGKRNRWL